MSTREALIEEIKKQPDFLLRELQHYLAFLVEQQKRDAAKNGWPERYFDKTAGAFSDEPFERPPQLPFEKRQEWAASGINWKSPAAPLAPTIL